MPPVSHPESPVTIHPALIALAGDPDNDVWRDRAALKIARQFALPIGVATVVADAAGLGGGSR
jgi:hypothetical protein